MYVNGGFSYRCFLQVSLERASLSSSISAEEKTSCEVVSQVEDKRPHSGKREGHRLKREGRSGSTPSSVMSYSKESESKKLRVFFLVILEAVFKEKIPLHLNNFFCFLCF